MFLALLVLRPKCGLSLPLLVLLIRTNHAHHALAAHDFTFVANPFHRRPNFHVCPIPVERKGRRAYVTASQQSARGRCRQAKAPAALDRRPGSARNFDPSDPQCGPSPSTLPPAAPDTGCSEGLP